MDRISHSGPQQIVADMAEIEERRRDGRHQVLRVHKTVGACAQPRIVAVSECGRAGARHSEGVDPLH
jgi:hypothetical protein